MALLALLRILATLLIYLHHHPIHFLQFPNFDFQREMHIGVSLFFGLSGFLLCQKYGLASKFSYQKYYANRFFKVFPLYWFVILVVILGQKTTEIDAILINILLLQGLWDNAQIWFIQPTWSLTVELIFYLFLPIFVRILEYNKRLFISICFFIAAFLAYEEAYFLLFADSDAKRTVG